MNKKLRMFFILFVLGALLATTACSSGNKSGGNGGGSGDSQSNQEQIALTYWNFTSTDMPFEKELIQKFEDAHPNIRIQLENVPVGEMHDKLLLAARSQSLPDVFQSIPEWTVDMATNNVAMDIGDQVGDVKDIYVQPALEMAVWDGKLYGLPWRYGTSATFVNTKLFEEANVPLPTNWTWEEFVDVAKKLTQPEKGIYGFVVPGSKEDLGTSWNWFAFLFQNGGSMLKDGKAAFNSPEGVEALQFLYDLLHTHKVMPPGTASFTSKDVTDAFGSGKVAMFQNGPWYIASVKTSYPDLEFTAVPLPTKKNAGSSAGGTLMSVSSGTKHKEAAIAFVKFMTGEEIAREWSVRGQFIPTVKSVLQDPAFSEPPVNVFAQAALDDTANITVIGATPENTRLMELLQSEIQEVLMGRKDPASALNSAAEAWNQILSQY